MFLLYMRQHRTGHFSAHTVTARQLLRWMLDTVLLRWLLDTVLLRWMLDTVLCPASI